MKKQACSVLILLVVIATPAWAQSIVTSGNIETDGQLVSNAAAGNAPLVVSSTTMVQGLNADQVDGVDGSDLALKADLLALQDQVDALGGVININQDCAVNTGCFEGDDPGFPVQIFMAGAYQLTSNLTVADANTNAILGLDISYDLNLNGFTINGPVVCTGLPATCNESGSGIAVQGTTIRVRSGTIRGFGRHGILLGEYSQVADMNILSNAGSGISGGLGPKYLRVTNSAISSNGEYGLKVDFGGAVGMLISNNSIQGNQLSGIRGTGGAFVNNLVTGNGSLGLNAGFGGQLTRFSGNTFLDNNGGNANDQTSFGEDLGGNLCGTRTTCP